MPLSELPDYGGPIAPVVTSVTSEEGYVRRGRMPRAFGTGDNELKMAGDEKKRKEMESRSETDDGVLEKVS